MELTEAIEMVKEYGCRVFDGHHFVYKSGKHGPAYINVDPILYQPWALYRVAQQLAEPYVPSLIKPIVVVPDVVADPAVGGISFGLLCALVINERIDDFVRVPEYMGKYPEQVMHVFAEKDKKDEKFAFSRTGFVDQLAGKKVLVVEDILNSGISAGSVIELAREEGAEVIGVSCLVNRGGLTAGDLGVPRLDPIIDIHMVQYEAVDCPHCVAAEPIVVDTSLGKGQEFRAEHPDYPGGFVTILS